MDSVAVVATAHLVTSVWPWVGLVCAVGLVLVYPTLVFRKYVRIIVNVIDDHAPVPENGEADRPGPQDVPGERVRFSAADGHELAGVIFSNAGAHPPRGMVVFAHAFGGDSRSCLRYCRSLLDAGYEVFAFDFRGHGASPPEDGYRPRQWPSDRERADTLGAITFVGSYLQRQGRCDHVGLVGVSRGGGAALLASVGVDQVRAIVTDGLFSSDTIIEYFMRRFATIFAKIRVVAENNPPVVWRILRWLLFREYRRRFRCRFPSVRKAIGCMGRKPILFIHGGKDSYIPLVHSQSLYALARGPKEFWAVPGARHNQSVLARPQEYGWRLVRFFDEHLARREEALGPRPAKRMQPITEAPLASPAYSAAYVAAPIESPPRRG